MAAFLKLVQLRRMKALASTESTVTLRSRGLVDLFPNRIAFDTVDFARKVCSMSSALRTSLGSELDSARLCIIKFSCLLSLSFSSLIA